ncbi:MAG: NAD(P)-dependent oxidoreductase [Balneolaceae bacterium]|nr:NAD(P)-dependent oxidoreductase [Balneolaceae bacterium]
MDIAFIGLGIMGSRMAKRLVTNNVNITLYNRTSSKAEPFKKYGATIANSIKECVNNKQVVFTMLSTPEVVKVLAFGTEGFINFMEEDTLWVDCSTVDPASSKYFAQEAAKLGIRFMDAPVAGTKQPAEKEELVFLVGGNEENLKEITPLLDYMGKKIIHAGNVGNGSSLKMLINLMLAQSIIAFSETVSLGIAMGFDQKMIHDVLLNTPVTAPFLKAIQKKLEHKDTTTNFPLKWMHKDLNLATKTAYKKNVAMPLANLTKELFAEAKSKGLGDNDFSCIYHTLNE